MPAVHFEVLWPDGDKEEYYSPSTVIYEFIREGQNFGMEEFAAQIEQALDQASERVRAKFGYCCSAAAAEQQKINHKFQQLLQQNIQGTVTVIRLR